MAEKATFRFLVYLQTIDVEIETGIGRTPKESAEEAFLEMVSQLRYQVGVPPND